MVENTSDRALAIREAYKQEYENRAWVQRINAAIHNNKIGYFNREMLTLYTGRKVVIDVIVVNTVKEVVTKRFVGYFEGGIDSRYEVKARFVKKDGVVETFTFQQITGVKDVATGTEWKRRV